MSYNKIQIKTILPVQLGETKKSVKCGIKVKIKNLRFLLKKNIKIKNLRFL